MNAGWPAFSVEHSAPTQAAFTSPLGQVGSVIAALREELLRRQRDDGAWCALRVGDGAAEAEILLLLAFVSRDDDPRQPRLIRALLERQRVDGGWGDFEATVRGYFALRVCGYTGDEIQAARERLASWGEGRCTARTRLLLALFGVLPHARDWPRLPAHSPADRWALQVLEAYRPVRRGSSDPLLAHVLRGELLAPVTLAWSPLRLWKGRRAGAELRQHLRDMHPNDLGGPTSILPLLALPCLQLDATDAAVRNAWRMLDERLIDDGDRLYVAPKLTPLSDTAHALFALCESGLTEQSAGVAAANAWLWRMLVRGQARGHLDVAEAAQSLVALARSGFAFRGDRPTLIDHVLNSIFDQQENDGSWGSPARTGKVLEALGNYGIEADEPVVADALAYLECCQEAGGSWPGESPQEATSRVLSGLRAVRHDPQTSMVRSAVAWLRRTQHAGGGWGDDWPTIGNTACALLGLMASGAANSPEADASVDWLLHNIDQYLAFQAGMARSGMIKPHSFLCPSRGEDSAARSLSLDELVYAINAMAQFTRHRGGFAGRVCGPTKTGAEES